MTQAELAEKANLSIRTIANIERGKACRNGTKRALLKALGFEFSEREQVFPREAPNEG